MSKVSVFAQKFKDKALEKSPEILIGMGITGFFTSMVLAIKATPKAMRLLEEEKNKKGRSLTAKEVIKTTWKCYIPAAVTGVASSACIVGADAVHTKRNAALAAAYSLSEATLKSYQSKVIETIGEKKEKIIEESVAKEKMDSNPIKPSTEVYVTGNGENLCYDSVSGRYFKSDIEKIRKAENYLNKQMRSFMYISLNEFYDEIGLPHISIGDDLGWNIDKAYIEIKYAAQIAENGQPCIVIDYLVAPRYDYRDLH